MKHTDTAPAAAPQSSIPDLNAQQVLALLMLDDEHTDLCDIDGPSVRSLIELGLATRWGRPLTSIGKEAAEFYGAGMPGNIIGSILAGEDFTVRPMWADDGSQPCNADERFAPEPKRLPR